MSTISQWCRYCGVENRSDAKSCYHCGRPLDAPDKRQQDPQPQQKNVASQQSERRVIIWRSTNFFVLLALLALCLIIGTSAIIIHLRSSSVPTVVWKVSSKDFSSQEQNDLTAAMKIAFGGITKQSPSIDTFSITSADRNGDWVVYYATPQEGSKVIGTQPMFFIAHREQGNWLVWLGTSPQFCAKLKQVPDSLFSPENKSYFCS
jgi:hypothetical protein